MWILYLLLFFLILGTLVTLHELGHFLVAKKCGVHIYEFSIGMGPLIHSHIGKDKIQYSIRALPIGGYVQMAGEVEEDDEKVKKEKFMCNKPWWQRILILIAGVTMNFITAFVLLFIIALIWGANIVEPKISEVKENSSYEQAGGRAGDEILSINGSKVTNWDVAQIELIMNTQNNEYLIEVKHSDNTTETLKVYPKITKQDKNEVKEYGIVMTQRTEKGFLAAIKYAFNKFGSIYQSMVKTIFGLFTGKLSFSSLSGPVGIYSVVEQSAKIGVEQVIYLMAFLSVNLGFVNLLPFPAFDGGHIVFVLIELIFRKPVNKKVEAIFHYIGFALIFLLLILVTIQDISRLF